MSDASAAGRAKAAELRAQLRELQKRVSKASKADAANAARIAELRVRLYELQEKSKRPKGSSVPPPSIHTTRVCLVDQLPDELIARVVSFAHPFAQLRCAKVSRVWRAASLAHTHGFNCPNLASGGEVHSSKVTELMNLDRCQVYTLKFRRSTRRLPGTYRHEDVETLPVAIALGRLVRQYTWSDLVRLVEERKALDAERERLMQRKRDALARRRASLCRHLRIKDLDRWQMDFGNDSDLYESWNRDIRSFMNKPVLRPVLSLRAAIERVHDLHQLAAERAARREDLNAAIARIKLDKQRHFNPYNYCMYHAFVKRTAPLVSPDSMAEKIAYEYWLEHCVGVQYRETVTMERRRMGHNPGNNALAHTQVRASASFRMPKKWPWIDQSGVAD